MRHHPTVVALRVVMRSMPALTNRGTALTTLVLVPLLQVALLLTIATALGVGDTVVVTYASLVVAAMGSVIAGGVSMVTRDRALGVAAEIMSTRPLFLRYWATRYAPAALISAVMGLVAATGVLLVEPAHDLNLYLSTVVGILLAVLVGGVAGLTVAAAALSRQDPYSWSNILVAALPITAGVLLPHSQYPVVLKELSALMPGTWLVEAIRGIAAGDTWANFGLSLLLEVAVAGGWWVAGLLLVRRAADALYRGAPSALL